MTIAYNAIAVDTAGQAIQHSDVERNGCAVPLDGKPGVVSDADADRLAAAGVEFLLVLQQFFDRENRR